jgi:hypothetical protein
MNHLSEEQLVEHYYLEGPDHADRAGHLAACPACASAFAALQQDLDAVEAIEAPACDEGYGEQVWNAVAGSLLPHKPVRASWLHIGWRRGLIYAGVCAMLVMGAFYAGRTWDHQKSSAIAGKPPAPTPQSNVILVVLGDHLDRSERLLIELKHAGDDADLAPPLRDEARKLLTSNEACRQNATQIGDPALAAALGRLETLLDDIANHPDSLSPSEITRLQDEKDIENLLFEVRVLRSRMPDQSIRPVAHSAGGTI